MRILIIEDEPHAAARVENLIKEIISGAIILAKLDSVESAVKWFKANPQPDLLLLDVQLADGISFEIFQQTQVTCPVIFTTAYDQYAMKAFKVNSIDYILKPVDRQELEVAVKKLKSVSAGGHDQQQLISNISNAVEMLMKKFKTRFVIKVGEHLRTIEVNDIRYFYSQDKASFCATSDNRNFILDYSMEQLDGMVDPKEFFRINRKYIVRSGSIQDIISYTNSRLRLVLKGCDDNDIIVARERVQEFKEWLDQ
jgi:DNA-binding LytR/AlgR family response regulator